MFFWLVRFLFNRGRFVPPFGRLFELFLAINAISLVLGLVLGSTLPLGLTVATVFKMLDAYVVFSAAYLAAQRYGYTDIRPFLTAIVAGEAIVVFLNVLAINLGLTGLLAQNPEFDAMSGGRERGLYYDPGVLGNMAFFSLVFTVFRFHLARSGKAIWLVFTIVIVLADLYLIAVSQSRAIIVEIGIFALIYMALYQRAWGKILAPIAIGVIVLIGASLTQSSYDEIFGRFESDVAALKASETQNEGVTASGKVSLGKFEGLGSNRGMLWAEALTGIGQRSVLEIVIGHFSYDVGGHSDYIDVLARNGVIGLIVYLMLLGGLSYRTFSYARSAAQGHDRVLHFLAFTLVLCFMLYAFPFRPLEYTTTAWYMWTMLAFSLAWGTRRPKPVVSTPPPPPSAPPPSDDEAEDPLGEPPEWEQSSPWRPTLR
jgi:hypothetical protein